MFYKNYLRHMEIVHMEIRREVVGVLFFHCACSGDQVQFLRLSSKYSYLQSLLTSPWKIHLLGLLIVPFLLFLLYLRSLLHYVVVSVLNPVLLLFLFWLYLVVVNIKWIQTLLALISLLNSLNYTRIYQTLLFNFNLN